MKPVTLVLFASLLLAVPTAWTSDGSPDTPDLRERLRQVREKQRTSAARMEASLERQRRAIERHAVAEPEADGLPRPLLAGAVAAPTFAMPLDCPRLTGNQADSLISAASAREQVGPDLLRGVIKWESAFRPCAVSPKGAMGLMQLMPATAARFGVSDPFDAEQNVNAGARFLKELLKRYGGDVSLALAAFNAGPERVDSIRRVPEIEETKEYVRRILGELSVTGRLF